MKFAAEKENLTKVFSLFTWRLKIGIYYPQGIVTLRVIMEDFNNKSKAISQELHVFSAVCRSMEVKLNSYREADEFNIEIDFKNFPFDPRAIRACGVTIHIEDRSKLFKTSNAKNVIQPDSTSIIFSGFVDTDTISLDSDRRTVRLEGRDFTSILIDRPYLGKPIAMTKSIDLVIRDLLDQLEETKLDPSDPRRGIRVVNLTGETLPNLAKLGVSLDEKSGKKSSRSDRSYWDMIQKFVADTGLIAYISLDQLVINKPRVLYDDSKRKLFRFGKNLTHLEFNRKLGRKKNFNVRVVALNTVAKEVIEAKIPLEATDQWAKEVGIKKAEVTIPVLRTDLSKAKEDQPAPYLTFRVSGISDKNTLIEKGQSIFEELGRQQIEGSLTTKDMHLCEVLRDGSNPSEFKTTDMRVGAAIELVIDDLDLKAIPDLINTTGREARKNKIVKYLKSQCYNARVAEAFAEAFINFDTPFYSRSMTFRLDQESGFEFSLDFINFIELPKNLTQASG